MKYLLHVFIISLFLIPISLTPQDLALANQDSLEKNEQTNVYIFFRDDCKHCQDADAFFTLLKDKRDDFRVVKYDLAIEQNKKLFEDTAKTYGLTQATPITLINNHVFVGFATKETTGELIEDLLNKNQNNHSFKDIVANPGSATVVSSLETSASACPGELGEDCEVETSSLTVTLPIIGTTIDTGTFSLVGLSLLLGFIDGFNPCAMWVLVMFLLILSQVGSKKRMIQYAGLFIFAEAVMYYLILNVWFTVFDFIGLNKIITPLIGLLALGSGAYFLNKYKNFSPVCNVADATQEKKLSQKIQELAKKPLSLAVIVGILGVAFAVNIFEFACSIGIPQAFTKILELNSVGFLQVQGYMLLYILMYMVDDLIVFGLAIWGLDKIAQSQKFTKWSLLIGGVLMILLGLLMLAKPEVLVF